MAVLIISRQKLSVCSLNSIYVNGRYEQLKSQERYTHLPSTSWRQVNKPCLRLCDMDLDKSRLSAGPALRIRQ